MEIISSRKEQRNLFANCNLNHLGLLLTTDSGKQHPLFRIGAYCCASCIMTLCMIIWPPLDAYRNVFLTNINPNVNSRRAIMSNLFCYSTSKTNGIENEPEGS